MKIKIFIIFLLSLLITGCYDYNEVNNIDIITGIGINYVNNEYNVTLEILNNKGDKTAIKLDSLIVNGNGITLADAINEATSNINKTPNYAHLSVLVLNENALDKWFYIMDYFLRSTEFRENFYVVTTNNSTYDIFNTKTNQNKVVSSIISNLFENQKYKTINKHFEDYAKDYTTFNKSLLFTNINIVNNNIVLDGATIYKNKINYLDNNNVLIYNIIQNKENRLLLNNNDYTIEITKSNLKMNIKNGKILINGIVNADIVNNLNNTNIKYLNNIDKINNSFKDILENRIINLLNITKEYNADIFGLDNKYYQNTRKKQKNYWLNLDYDINIDFKINKKGLIYEVEYEK